MFRPHCRRPASRYCEVRPGFSCLLVCQHPEGAEHVQAGKLLESMKAEHADKLKSGIQSSLQRIQRCESQEQRNSCYWSLMPELGQHPDQQQLGGLSDGVHSPLQRQLLAWSEELFLAALHADRVLTAVKAERGHMIRSIIESSQQEIRDCGRQQKNNWYRSLIARLRQQGQLTQLDGLSTDVEGFLEKRMLSWCQDIRYREDRKVRICPQSTVTRPWLVHRDPGFQSSMMLSSKQRHMSRTACIL